MALGVPAATVNDACGPDPEFFGRALLDTAPDNPLDA